MTVRQFLSKVNVARSNASIRIIETRTPNRLIHVNLFDMTELEKENILARNIESFDLCDADVIIYLW